MTNQAPWVKKYGLSEPYGKCQCGCGNDAPVSDKNVSRLGYAAGEPARFLHGHNKAIVPVEDRFFSKIKIDPVTQCWEWQAAKSKSGYGVIGCASPGNKRRIVTAHRLSYEIHIGPIPADHFVCHRCDNPGCVNPGHLFIGTNADNVRDMHNKARGFVPTPAMGADHFNAKLTEDIVRQIRDRFSRGETKTHLAREFGVSINTVSMVIKRATWRHVT